MIKRLELESLAFVFFGAVVGLFLVAYTRSTTAQFHSNAAAPAVPFTMPGVPTTVPPTAIPTPTTVFISTKTTTSQISPDGTKKVTVTTATNRDKTQTASISIDDGTATLFTKILQPDQVISVPFNTWAPDNHFFFLQIISQNTKDKDVMVFKADGSPFGDGSPYMDLTDAYKAHTEGNPFEVTGWGGYNLIVINTTLADGSQGTSYWYEIPDGAVIPLSTKF